MASITYYVAMGFEHDSEGELVALEPMEARSPNAAVARAKALATTKARALAFARTGDPNLGEFADAVVLLQSGEIPEIIPA